MFFVRLVGFFFFQGRSKAAYGRRRKATFLLFPHLHGEEEQKKKKKQQSDISGVAASAASWSVPWIYASRPASFLHHMEATGPADDYSDVRLTHKNPIWQKKKQNPASFTDETPRLPATNKPGVYRPLGGCRVVSGQV